MWALPLTGLRQGDFVLVFWLFLNPYVMWQFGRDYWCNGLMQPSGRDCWLHQPFLATQFMSQHWQFSSRQLSTESPWPEPPISHHKRGPRTRMPCRHSEPTTLCHCRNHCGVGLGDSREMVQETPEQMASCVREDLHEEELRMVSQAVLKRKALKIAITKQARHGCIHL